MTVSFLFGLWIIIGLFTIVTLSPITIQNGGYEGIVVTISEDVPSENCRLLISNLEVSRFDFFLLL
ncbi:UNVERIFIED_CONTAM: hypothetical protein PYX00_002439 [Menopon gallinae]|uniref:ATP synthase F0 subunit 8 n=1 Tax=Menopon gallinae TaxID=328185 RepID=A0AAW2IIW7_9NEOP